jgi:hypothetical protein
MPTAAEQAERNCNKLLSLSPAARQAFTERQAKLIDWGTRIDETGAFIGVHPWPMHRWYTDEDFCRAYNTACTLADIVERAKRLSEAVAACPILGGESATLDVQVAQHNLRHAIAIWKAKTENQ